MTGESNTGAAAGSPPVASAKAPPLSAIHQDAVPSAASAIGGRKTCRSSAAPVREEQDRGRKRERVRAGHDDDPQGAVGRDGRRIREDVDRAIESGEGENRPAAERVEPQARRPFARGRQDQVEPGLVPPRRRGDDGHVREADRLDRRRGRRRELPHGPVAPVRTGRRRAAQKAHAEPVRAAGVQLVAAVEGSRERAVAEVNVHLARSRRAESAPDELVGGGLPDLPVAADMSLAGRAREGARDHVNVVGVDDLAVRSGFGDDGSRDGGRGREQNGRATGEDQGEDGRG